MTIIEQIEKRSSALKVGEVAKLLEVTPQHIYGMASQGLIPSFRVGGAIRFDPQELATWLKSRYPKAVRGGRVRGGRPRAA
jgi:excisionase family DNA binding protein